MLFFNQHLCAERDSEVASNQDGIIQTPNVPVTGTQKVDPATLSVGNIYCFYHKIKSPAMKD